jgi:hypothetical protein
MYTYNEDETEFLHESPSQGMLFRFVWRIAGGGLIRLSTGGCALLFNKDICDEAVNDRGAHGRIGSRPEHHTRSGQDLERIQHGGCGFGADGRS